MRSLLPLISIFALSLYAWAADEQTPDALGCVIDDITGSYRCGSGPLEGREFMNADEARAALRAEDEKKMKDKEDEAFASAIEVPLKVLVWDFAGVGRKYLEYDRIAALIGEVDLVVLQDVEFTPSGESPLLVLTKMVESKIGQRICKGWFKTNSGARGRHAFIWKDKAIAFVEPSGIVKEHCPEAPTVIRLDQKKIEPSEVLSATFYLKSRLQMFTAAVSSLAQKPKRAKDVSAVFTKLAKSSWPVLLTGSFHVPPSDKIFKDALKSDFKAAFARGEPNLWTRRLSVLQASRLDLAARFPEATDKIAESPARADISFSTEEAEQLRTQLIKKDQRALDAEVRHRKSQPVEKTKAKPLDVHDDVESEAGD